MSPEGVLFDSELKVKSGCARAGQIGRVVDILDDGPVLIFDAGTSLEEAYEWAEVEPA